MSVEIYLGKPPAHIEQWIKDHLGPISHPETRFTLQNGTIEPYDIIETLDQQWMIDNGYQDKRTYEWIKTITYADIGNTVTSIGDDTFDSCSSLMSVTIPNTVTSIGRNAFFLCKNLENVTIPNLVTTIGQNAFSECNGLLSVNFDCFDVATAKDQILYYLIFGNAFFDENDNKIEKTILINCTNGSFNVIFKTNVEDPFEDPIEFQDL